MTAAAEVNFDGIVGPTHHYGGLAAGNVASAANAGLSSRPKEAALQGLAKMKAMFDLGLIQGVLPPQERPHIPTLRSLGFDGGDGAVLQAALQADPRLLEAASSASAMWAANAATVSPSPDTADGRVHLTVANLSSQFHRSIEAGETQRILEATFPAEELFAVHAPLPSAFGDEGAANHTRLTRDYASPGIELFVFGAPGTSQPSRYRARQHRGACEAVIRRHGLAPSRTILAQQSPAAIDQGVFHNDVISVGNLDVFFFHERAFLDPVEVKRAVRSALPGVRLVEVPESRVAIDVAVGTYLFNSQLVKVGAEHVLVAPQEVRSDSAVWEFVTELLEGDSAIDRVLLFDLRQSMRNGGGPACLRLRVVLTGDQQAHVNAGSLLTEERYAALVAWVHRHYRDELLPGDLADPSLLDQSRTALDELSQLLGLGAIYDFQR